MIIAGTPYRTALPRIGLFGDATQEDEIRALWAAGATDPTPTSVVDWSSTTALQAAELLRRYYTEYLKLRIAAAEIVSTAGVIPRDTPFTACDTALCQATNCSDYPALCQAATREHLINGILHVLMHVSASAAETLVNQMGVGLWSTVIKNDPADRVRAMAAVVLRDIAIDDTTEITNAPGQYFSANLNALLSLALRLGMTAQEPVSATTQLLAIEGVRELLFEDMPRNLRLAVEGVLQSITACAPLVGEQFPATVACRVTTPDAKVVRAARETLAILFSLPDPPAPRDTVPDPTQPNPNQPPISSLPIQPAKRPSATPTSTAVKVVAGGAAVGLAALLVVLYARRRKTPGMELVGYARRVSRAR